MEVVAEQKDSTAEALLANMGAACWSAAAAAAWNAWNVLPFLSLQLLPSLSPAGLLQAKPLQNLTSGLNARKALC